MDYSNSFFNFRRAIHVKNTIIHLHDTPIQSLTITLIRGSLVCLLIGILTGIGGEIYGKLFSLAILAF